MRIPLPALLVLLACLTSYGPARAGGDTVPEYSTVEPALVLCPAADLPFQVWARITPDILAFRVWEILVDVTDAPGLRLAATQPAAGCAITTYAGRTYAIQQCAPFGYACFRLSGGGAATGVSLPVLESHGGLVLATRVTFLSPDQNGDLVVDGEDLAIARAKLGSADPTADFDFDGAVTADDLALAQAHLGHLAAANAPVAARAESWGRLKALFGR